MPRIAERRQEASGRWVVRIVNDAETRSLFLTFKTEPSNQQIRDAFSAVINAEQEEDTRRAESDAVGENIVERIKLYKQGELTAVQARALLDDIIDRLKEQRIRI